MILLKEKIREGNDVFNAPVTIGIVGHCDIEDLSRLKQVIQELEGFDLVFFKTSSGRLWIKEGGVNNDTND